MGEEQIEVRVMGLSESLERIMAEARKVPDPDAICRCGDYWKNGRRTPVGWVFVSEKGHGLVRRCERCNPRLQLAPERGDAERFE